MVTEVIFWELLFWAYGPDVDASLADRARRHACWDGRIGGPRTPAAMYFARAELARSGVGDDPAILCEVPIGAVAPAGPGDHGEERLRGPEKRKLQIGRASCRER